MAGRGGGQEIQGAGAGWGENARCWGRSTIKPNSKERGFRAGRGEVVRGLKPWERRHREEPRM